VRVLGRIMVTVMAWFMPVMREVKEMLYLFENPILLDDSKLKRILPDFKPTPLPVAISETLSWFKEHRIK